MARLRRDMAGPQVNDEIIANFSYGGMTYDEQEMSRAARAVMAAWLL